MKLKSKKKKKWMILGAIAVIAVAAVGFQVFNSKEDPGVQVSTGNLTRGDVRQVVSIKGTVEGSETANIASSEEKEITAILVKEGDVVRKGQVLASLKPNPEDGRTQWNYDKEAARQSLELAQYEYDTNKALYEAGGLSKQELMKTETAYQNSKTHLAALNAKTFEENRDSIVSPISGTVTRVNATLGLKANDTQNKGALFVVENLSHLEMNVKASEYDIGKIQLGQSVEISAEVLGEQKVTGVVSHISPTGELKETGSKEMVIPVRISVTQAGSNLIAGVTGKANILTNEAKNVQIVPLDAVVLDANTGKVGVFVVKKGLAKKVEITLGLESDFVAELKEGTLTEKDRLILNPPDELTDGTPVKVDAPKGTDGKKGQQSTAAVATV